MKPSASQSCVLTEQEPDYRDQNTWLDHSEKEFPEMQSLSKTRQTANEFLTVGF